jgi:hypothetical protein
MASVAPVDVDARRAIAWEGRRPQAEGTKGSGDPTSHGHRVTGCAVTAIDPGRA